MLKARDATFNHGFNTAVKNKLEKGRMENLRAERERHTRETQEKVQQRISRT